MPFWVNFTVLYYSDYHSGLLGKIGELIAKHDPDADFVAGFQDKVISFLYDKKNKKCTTGV